MKKRTPDEALKESPKTGESPFLKFTWVAVVLLAIILGGVGLSYMILAQLNLELRKQPTWGQMQLFTGRTRFHPWPVTIATGAWPYGWSGRPRQIIRRGTRLSRQCMHPTS